MVKLGRGLNKGVRYTDVAMTDDSIVMDRQLYNQLLSMLESLSDLQFRTELAERHIGEINNDLSLLRKHLGI